MIQTRLQPTNSLDTSITLVSRSSLFFLLDRVSFLTQRTKTGRVSTIQLDYSKAYRNLTQAIRKAPQSTALGFRITVRLLCLLSISPSQSKKVSFTDSVVDQSQKLLCIVQLLIGEIPEKTIFQQKGMIKALKPYFDLSAAVRIGDLAAFQSVVKQNEDIFRKDRNLALIQRSLLLLPLLSIIVR